MQMSTPCPPGRSKALNAMPAPQVLSSALVTPRDRATATSAARSGNSIVIEPGASSHTSRVRSVIASASDCGFIAS